MGVEIRTVFKSVSVSFTFTLIAYSEHDVMCFCHICCSAMSLKGVTRDEKVKESHFDLWAFSLWTKVQQKESYF